MLRVAIASLTLCVILSVSIPSAFAANVVMTGGSISATLIDSSYALIGPNFLAQGGSELTGNGLSSTNFAPGGLLTENTFVNMSFPGDLIIADGVSGNHNGFFPNVLSNANLSLTITGSTILPNIDVLSFTLTWAVILNGNFDVTNGVSSVSGLLTGTGIASSQFQRWADCSRFTACYQAVSPLVITIQSVPEPSAGLLLSTGIGLLLLRVKGGFTKRRNPS
jgi:hypothetical protein